MRNAEGKPNLGLSLTLAAVMSVATMAAFMVGVLGPFLLGEFGLSRVRLGALTTVIFAVAGVGSPLAGALVDRFGGLSTTMYLFLMVAIGIACMGTATSFIWLILAMALFGCAQALANPATNGLIHAHVPVKRFGSVMGVKQAGIPMAKLLTGVALPGMALSLGWRIAVLATLLLPLTALSLVKWFVPRAGSTPAPSRWAPLTIPRTPVLWLSTYALLMGMGIAVINIFLPLYAYEVVGMSIRAAGLAVALLAVVDICARILWGRIGERSDKVLLSLLVQGFGSAIAAIMLLLAQNLGAYLLWLSVVLFGGLTMSWTVTAMLSVIKSPSMGNAGEVTGIVILGFYVGFVPSPLLAGLIIDMTSEYDWVWIGVSVAFAMAAIVSLGWHARDG